MHEIYIDYLQASGFYKEHVCTDRGDKEIPGFGFYNRGYKDSLGVRRYYGNPNTQKALMVYPGASLHNRRVIGWSDKSLIEEMLSNNCKISRIDWCVTDYVDTHLCTPKLVRTTYRLGKISGTLASYGAYAISGENVGQPSHVETFYIGKAKRRGKSGIFRAYDKGLELGIAKDIIARLELEERGDNAHNSAKRHLDGASIQSIMQSRLRFEHEQFERIFNDPPVDISRGDNLVREDPLEEVDKRWAWLMKQVAPALREAIIADANNGMGNERMLQFLRLTGIILDERKNTNRKTNK